MSGLRRKIRALVAGRLASVAGLVYLVAANAGCSTARLPARSTLAQPCVAYLMHDPLHPVLALPDERGRYVGFGFGDRGFLPTTGWAEVPLGAWLVLVGFFGQFTDGAMERVEYRGSTPEALAKETGMEVEELVVERARADALRRRLDSKCGPQVVPHDWLFETDDGYSVWWDNCHSATAFWLRELGAEVSRFRLAPRWAGWTLEAEEP